MRLARRSPGPRTSAPAIAWLLALGLLVLGSDARSQEPAAPAPAAPASGPVAAAPAPQMKNLGGERYRIGNVLVERRKQRLTVPGVLIRNTGPLEYFAVTKGGFKRYEALLELETTGTEFNLACILLGLDPEKTTRSKAQFSPEPMSGQRVGIRVEWKDARGKQQGAGPLEMLLTDEQRAKGVPDEWVYAGSFTNFEGAFAADRSGALVGLVHDPASVVEHVAGLGIGAYGSVGGNPAVLPPLETPVTLTMTVLEKGRAR